MKNKATKEVLPSVAEKEAKVLDKEIAPFVAKAVIMEIKNANQMIQATETLSRLNQYADSVDAKKQTIVKPISDALKAARALFSPIEAKLEEGIGSIRQAMSQYQTEQKRLADEEAAKIANRVGEGKGKIKAETAVKKMEEIDRPATGISTESGSIKFKTVQKFEVMDVALLPKEYILPNDTAIRDAMKAKIEIPGVRYYTEEVPVNFR